ncbi:MAG: NAD(P)-binding domain-containing protein [Bacteroidales bacterium]|nr:NAD(P)-binding domain-containing protein [Bacteroidales bacterium]
MSRFGLIGNPISHSKSPALFKAGYGECNHTYSLFETQTVEEAIELFKGSNIKGVNVTSPFKDAVMAFVDFPDRISSILGSANVLLKGDGEEKLFSYNTDYYGVKNTINEFLSELDSGDKKRRVAVIGAGGAGKAAALAMCDSGYEVTLVNRSAGRIKEFADLIGASYMPLDSVLEVVSNSDIIIYSLAFPVAGIESADLKGKIIFEANYAKPSLARCANLDSVHYIDGRYWLYHQAIPAFELFTGESPNILEMRKVMGLE